jgi:hypothetical protein
MVVVKVALGQTSNDPSVVVLRFGSSRNVLLDFAPTVGAIARIGDGTGTHATPTRWNPALQTKSHAVPLQIGLAPGGALVHGVHDAPHCVTLVDSTHEAPQRW